MKRISGIIACAAVLLLTGCGNKGLNDKVISEGVLFMVEYEMGNGRTGGFTRMNNHVAVPGRNGSWNVDAYGRLTADFLFITRPQQKNDLVQVIPVDRIVTLRFGKGGIKKVDSKKFNPAG